MKNEPLLRVSHLCKTFQTSTSFFQNRPQLIQAVDDVSFTMKCGETIGLVGESGCGKSTLGRCILRLYEPSSGQVHFHNTNVLTADEKTMRALRTHMQIVFQDPFSSLNPRMNIGSILSEPLLTHHVCQNREEARKKVNALLVQCGLSPEMRERYPHQFSGGQRQRIGIARAISLSPEFIVCDEPVSALDVSVQAQILNLMMDLQKKMGLSYLFISHDLGVVRHISHRVGVMYLGSIVELADKEDLYETPLHPYTQMLLAAIPSLDPEDKNQTENVKGEIPSNTELPSGCKFHTRCPYAQLICVQEVPTLSERKPGHFAACHFANADKKQRSIPWKEEKKS